MQLNREEHEMIVEYIRYKIAEGREDEFEDAYRRGGEVLDRSPNCERYEISRCVEEPDRYVVRIEWDSEEGHLSGFRGSPDFRVFLQAVGPFIDEVEEMRHYDVKIAT
jgi:heme-degrading monooxygenase HmoA